MLCQNNKDFEVEIARAKKAGLPCFIERLAESLEFYKQEGFRIINVQEAGESVIDIKGLNGEYVVETNASFEYYADYVAWSDEEIEKWYETIATKIENEFKISSDKIVITGGFHINHCVNHMAKALRKITQNVHIDAMCTDFISRTDVNEYQKS